MPKPKPICIEIPDPCHQSWDGMTPADGGRHCAHCNKVVTDFTTWTDRKLHQFLTNKPGQVCGRFLNTQVGRVINIPYQPHSRLYRIVAGLGLALIFTQVTNAQTNVRPPLQQQQPHIKSDHNTSKAKGIIRGRVLDDKKEPLINAAVQVFQNNILMGGIVTDFDGNYAISPLDEGYYDLVIVYVGFDSFKEKGILVKDTLATTVNVTVTLNRVITGAVRTTTIDYKKPLLDIDNPDKTILTKEEIDRLPK